MTSRVIIMITHGCSQASVFFSIWVLVISN
jgi:hypothetical protein